MNLPDCREICPKGFFGSQQRCYGSFDPGISIACIGCPALLFFSFHFID
jgi:hypothetical protein